MIKKLWMCACGLRLDNVGAEFWLLMDTATIAIVKLMTKPIGYAHERYAYNILLNSLFFSYKKKGKVIDFPH